MENENIIKAPETIPSDMLIEYLMGGDAYLEYSYLNDCSEETQNTLNGGFTKHNFDSCIQRIKNKEENYYGTTDKWMYEALEKYPLKDKDVCIMGSTYPWYEAMVIEYEVKSCTVIEYSKRDSFHEKITYIQPHEITNQKFDVCISISSYEHDGLGRYGDPLNPNGDIEAMVNTKKFLNKDSLLYLAVPIGIDKVVFNKHRVYGPNRIKKLLSGWETVDRFGFFADSFSNNVNGVNGTPYQPIYILKNI
tara:strand:+ start:122 stop:868 length:747 start_codon:yes stop_codon:yes gene_type:complete